MPDMYEKYKQEVIPALIKKYGYKNIMEVPRLQKIVVSMGISTATERDAFNEAKEHIATFTGQVPVITKARKSIANFKLRQGMPVGLMVTLRSRRLYEFLDRLVHNVFPRVRDFRGLSPKKGFDHRGNYSIGIQDITVFPEVNPDKVKRQFGVNISFVTTAKTDEEAFALLELLDMPFAKPKKTGN